ncbi:MAG: thiamine pyrophosphate-dependent enzyme [Anaerolineae bacterium]
MVAEALNLSERHGTPVFLRPTTRLCHAVQSIALPDDPEPDAGAPNVKFRKDPGRWTATPKFRNKLHHELNQKLQTIEAEFEASPLNYVVNAGSSTKLGIIASGVAFHTAVQSLAELNAQIPVLKIGTPYPLPRKKVADFLAQFEAVIVIEEPDACMELQMPNRSRVHGRLNGAIPNAGELTPEVIAGALSGLLAEAGFDIAPPPHDAELQTLINELPLPVRRPRLCPGCSHRSTFFALKREFGPRAIYPGDIGCYTLGMNLRAVDSFVDMGASVTMADGFYQAGRIVGDNRPIIATIGDSTFLHSGIPPLINAVHTGARFVLLILDNHTTAMTGFQPTAANEMLADGREAPRQVSIPDIVRACGVGFVEVADPYEHDDFRALMRRAHDYTQDEAGGVAVLVADRPCVLYDREPILEHPVPVVVTEECDGCRFCVEAFECPALVLYPERNIVDIDYKICVECGQCIDACYKGFIVPKLVEIAA